MSTLELGCALPSAPFRGLEEFRYADRLIFFGRQEETAKLLRTITIYRGALFYGDSGTGKSSLINAGLMPAAISQDFAPERLRFQPRLNEEIVVERLVESDGSPPSFLLSRILEGSEEARGIFSTEEFERRLWALDSSIYPLLIFDQFEELITLTEETARGTDRKAAQRAQERVLAMVVRLLRDPAARAKLLFVFREDYLAKLAPLFALVPELTDQFVRLTPLKIGRLRELIRGPFELAGSNWGKSISASITDLLRKEFEQRGDLAINLSEVQVACLQLWRSPDPEELYEKKKAVGLLEDFLSESLSRMKDKDLADPAVALLSTLVTASGTRNVISAEDAVQAVRREEKVPKETVERALGALVSDTKLVNRELRHSTFFYEIVSEFLVPWILRQKIERQQRRARRKLIRQIAIVLAVLLGGCLIAGYTWVKFNNFEASQTKQVKDAEAKRADAKSAFERTLKNQRDEIQRRDSELDRVRRLAAANEKAAQKNIEGLQAEIRTNDLSMKDLSNKLTEQAGKAKNDLDAVRRTLTATEADLAAQKVAFQRERDIAAAEGKPVYRIGAGVTAPSVIFKVDPEYTEEARKIKYSGTVALFVIVDADGTVKNAWLDKSIGMGLDEKAMEAVQKWKFKPAMRMGKPVNSMATIEVNFRLL